MFSRLTGRLCTSFAVALVVLSSAAAPTSAQDAAAFYKGKTVKFIVGNAPGGGFDAYARMLAPHLEKQLGATVVVQNQPGAGGLVALNSVYKATGDGLQLMMVNGLGGVLAQLVDDPSVRFDLSKMGVLGIVSYSPYLDRLPKIAHEVARRLPQARRQGHLGGVGPDGGIERRCRHHLRRVQDGLQDRARL